MKPSAGTLAKDALICLALGLVLVTVLHAITTGPAWLLRLVIFGVLTYVGGSIANDQHDTHGSWEGAWASGAKFSLCLAALAWILTGQPTCTDSDGMRCYEHANDGYEATFAQRNESFAGILAQTMTAGTLGLWLAKTRKDWSQKRKD